jgi:hypothetical protein
MHSTTFGHEHWKDGWKPVPADIKKWLIEAAQMEVQDGGPGVFSAGL